MTVLQRTDHCDTTLVSRCEAVKPVNVRGNDPHNAKLNSPITTTKPIYLMRNKFVNSFRKRGRKALREFGKL